MSENIDFVEKSTSFVSMMKAFVSSTEGDDNQYRKANRKNELKLIKLNSDNYQSWANGMKILLNVKNMWPLITSIVEMPPSSKSNDCSKWLADDVQTKIWIYTNLKNTQHNHIKKSFTANSMWIFLKKVHETFGQRRLNFFKRRFFSYQADSNEIIDEIVSNFSRLQMTIRDIKKT